jgi:hypothetical protein
MTDPTTVTFTVKELLQRLDERLSAVDQKLDGRLAHIDERLVRLEREIAVLTLSVGAHEDLKEDVDGLKTFRARFLPATVVGIVLAALAIVVDVFLRTSS